MDKAASRAHHHHHHHQHSHQHPHNHHHLHSHHHHNHSHHHPSHHHSHFTHQAPHHYPNYAHYQPHRHHDQSAANQEQLEANQSYDNQNYDSQNQSLSTVAHLGSQLAAQSKRKEKARIAARARRSQEAQIIMEMANELHISQEKIRRIDKATIVKLAIDYIKAFEILCRFCSTCCQPAALASAEPRIPEKAIESTTETANTTTTTSSATTTTTADTTAAAGCQPEQEDDCSERDTTSTSCIAPIQLRHCDERALARPAPKLSTGLIFAPRTDDMDSHFLMIRERDGRAAFVLEPDSQILDDDDLTHLAPQAGDTSISLEVEPLEGIVLDTGLFAAASPKCAAGKLRLDAPDTCCNSDDGRGTNIEAATV